VNGTSSVVDSQSQTTSRDDSPSAATSDVTVENLSSHPLLADQPEVVRQLVATGFTRWNARASDVTSAPLDADDRAIQLDVLEVDGDLASSVMPQVQ